MTTRHSLHSLTSAGSTALIVASVLCIMMAFCGDVSAESINRDAVSIWRRGYLEMYEAGEQLKKKNDREAFLQYRTAKKYFEEVRQKHPKFEPEMVNFRLEETKAAIAALQAKHPNDLYFRTENQIQNQVTDIQKKHSELERKYSELEKKNSELTKKNTSLEKQYQQATVEIKAGTDTAIVNRMLTAANEFNKLLKDDHADPKTVADANARYKLYVNEVKRVRDILYPKNYVIGGIVNGVWMLDAKTGKPIFIKPEEIRKRGLPAMLLN